MNSIHIEWKSVAVERFIRILKTKINKYMTLVSKNVYINKLEDIVREYNKTYLRTIKMKPVDVKYNIYIYIYIYIYICIDFKKEVNDKNPKLKVGDRVIISKYKNIFAKGYTPNRSEDVFVIKQVKNTVPWRHVIIDFNGEEIIGIFYEKEL